MAELLGSQMAPGRGLYNVHAILRALEKLRGVDSHSDVTLRLFRVAQFEMWNRMLKDEA